MKNKFLKYLVLLPAILFMSCDNWLNITPKGKVVMTTVDQYEKLFDGTEMIIYQVEDINALNDDQWYSPAVVNNAITGSMTRTAANFMYIEDFDRVNNANGNGVKTTRTFYEESYLRISRTANLILANMSTIIGSESEKTVLAAQAKMLRAYNYFMLVNVHAKHYDKATAATDGAVPLVLTFDLENFSIPKATVEHIYQQIEKDIAEALVDLPATAKTPYRFTKAAAYAFKAKVHLFKKEFDLCKAAALESYNLNHEVVDLVSRVDAANYVLKMPIWATESENLFFATVPNPNPQYYYIGMDLINLYKENGDNDMRFKLYKFPSGTVANNNDNAYTAVTNFVNTGATAYPFNACGIRTTEVLLMLAECYAREGKYAETKQYLVPLLEKRIKNFDPAALVIPTNVTDAVKLVLKERRKELTMGYTRFFDLRRMNTEDAYKVTLSRLIPANPSCTYVAIMPQKTFTLSPTSKLYVLPFPQKVLDNNPALSSNTNN